LVVDAGVGWRIPGRAIIGTLQVKNLFDSRFNFQDPDPTNSGVHTPVGCCWGVSLSVFDGGFASECSVRLNHEPERINNMSNGPRSAWLRALLLECWLAIMWWTSLVSVSRMTDELGIQCGSTAKVDKDSVRINRFFRAEEIAKDAKPPYTKEAKPPYTSDGSVFGFPFDGPLGDPWRCYYNYGGIPTYKDFPSPPVPPCPL
jgi:hypothetical protein